MLTSEEVMSELWGCISKETAAGLHNSGGLAVNHLLKYCMHRRGLDNLTVVFIGLKNILRVFGLDKKRQ